MGIATRVNGAAPPEVALGDIDLGAWDFWSLDDDLRDGAFSTLRREAPISFWPEPAQEGFEGGPGHWALTELTDVLYASRHPEIFSSSPNITINDQPPEVAEFFGSMIVLDDPRHQLLRSVANHPDGNGEAVSELAGPLPLQVICDMMGIPEEDHQRVFHWTNVILGFGDPDLATDFEEFAQVSIEIGGYATALAEERRSNPGDDLTTSLVHADVDGEQLTSAEVASFFILLAVAGNETTRNAISHGLLALTRYPEQRQTR